MPDQPLLRTEDVSVYFGSLAANHLVNIDMYRGEVTGLIGPNGAGKTTLFNAITGVSPASDGRVYFKNIDITKMLPHSICKLGMSRTFQVTRAFLHMTVEDTIRVGAYNRNGENTVQDKVDEVIEYCGLESIRHKLCGDISLAMQRRVEVARSLATEPELLLLDESGAGLNPTELEFFMNLLRRINKEKRITLCVVEHVMQMVMNICDRIYVLETGHLIASGTPQEISNNQRVIDAYLGKRSVHVA
ncbi:MAG TPA: ABC transporter ATP-binding protein [Bellilinea sp.]|nr:ABC transporter ATP-binding protein [Bellilinea sp.]